MKVSVVPLLRSSLAAMLSVALLGACVDQGQGDVQLGDASLQAGSALNATPQILQRMQEASGSIAFHGERRYFARTKDGDIEQLEEVGSDGAGRFAFELTDVLSLPSTLNQYGYEIETESAWRFAQNIRDPRIVSAAATARNFFITTTDATPNVAGIDCIRLRFRRHVPVGDRPGDYEADVDPNTGFALAWREFDASGQVLTSLTYESFEYKGDLSSMTLRGRVFTASPLAIGQPLGPQASFQLNVPAIYHEGVELIAGEIMTVPQEMAASLPPGQKSYLVPGEWLRLVATDGIEVTVFAHSKASSQGGIVAGELRPSTSLSWNIGHGRLKGTSYVVATRAPMVWVQRIVMSAF